MLMTAVGGGAPALAAANPGLQRWLLGALGLPFFLTMTLLTGAELFTGNTFTMTLGWLEGRVTGDQLARNWGLSFTGNLAGALVIAWAGLHVRALSTAPMVQAAIAAAKAKAGLPFGTAVLKGLLCNWMVCMAVYQASASSSVAGKFVGILGPVSTFVALGFEHSVANMFLLPQGMLLGADVSMEAFLLRNLLPVTLGNILGGAVCVAAIFSYCHGENSMLWKRSTTA
eukprot:SM000005S17273  [mRNA]  locus=s5:1136676:1138768:- [translate_table: standard]